MIPYVIISRAALLVSIDNLPKAASDYLPSSRLAAHARSRTAYEYNLPHQRPDPTVTDQLPGSYGAADPHPVGRVPILGMKKSLFRTPVGI